MKKLIALITLLVLTTTMVFASSVMSLNKNNPPFSKKTTCEDIDINQDGIVNHPDLGILFSEWRNTGCGEDNNWCERADINRNKRVFFEDLRFLIRFYGQEC